METNNAVFGSLLENLDQIKIIYKETYDAFKNDKANTGNAKEYSIQEFIAAYLTSDYRIQKGVIYSKDSFSNNIDCVILAPSHPILTTPKRQIILAEGVYAAVEVKPDIRNKEEFARALQQVKSVKRLERETYNLSQLTTGPLPDHQKRIPAVIFSAKSLDPNDQYTFIKQQIKDGNLTVNDLPDMILTLDHGLYSFSIDISTKLFGKLFLEEFREFTRTTMLHFCDAEQATTLALFISHLINLPSPTILMHSPILNKYMNFPHLSISGFDYGKK